MRRLQCRLPVLGDIPWLFADPQSMRAQWRGRLQFLVLSIEREVRTLRTELAGDLSVLARQRLELLAAAYEDHARRLTQMLTPLDFAATNTGYETHLALRTRLPTDQGLTNYYVNLHRDWAWGTAENDASLALIRSVAEHPRKLGQHTCAGSGVGSACVRYAYAVCATAYRRDGIFNPLLLFVARDVTRGAELELYEFPIAPRRLADHAILRSLSAPQPVRAAFHIVAADALRAPFAPEAFDTVVTPWLIDIVSEDFASLAARVNALLRPGGSWINFGSLAFSQGTRAQRLSFEETLEIIGRTGFAQPAIGEQSIPYMASPASRHARLESVVAWCARKESAAPPATAEGTLPDWIVLGDRPVPLLEEFQSAGGRNTHSRLCNGAHRRSAQHSRHGANACRAAAHKRGGCRAGSSPVSRSNARG